MHRIEKYVERAEYSRLVALVCQGIIGTLAFAVTFLVFVWGVYFLCRVRELMKKMHYLKKQTDERCKEELTNARVDYIKSVFIAAICLVEGLNSVSIYTIIASHPRNTKEKSFENCGKEDWTVETFDQKYTRNSLAAVLSLILVYISLVHILTSYLSNAYAEKRIVRLTRREKLMFLLLFTQLVILWVSVINWRAFIFVVFLYTISVFPIHLCLFIRYSRKTYTSLKRRALDAWYEDAELHKRLEGMCKEYKQGSILYVVSMILIGLTLTLMPLGSLGEMVFKDKCRLNFIFNINPDFDWLNNVYKQNKQTLGVVGDILTISNNVLAVITFAFLFALNAFILYQAVKRLLKRRTAYNTYTGTRKTELYRPLIGNK